LRGQSVEYDQKSSGDQMWWLTPIILATQEAEIRTIAVGGQPGQKVCKTPSQPIVGCGRVCLSFQLCEKQK
jgi:hypothetical protein